MFPKVNPTTTPSWQALLQHRQLFEQVQMKDLFFNDTERFSRFSIQMGDVLFDYSKNIITENTVEILLELAADCKLKDAVEAMFNGEKINETENRAVLHTALRNFSGKPVLTDGIDVMPGIKQVLEQMKSFCTEVHSGGWKGYTGT
jgi:glucose-6-phosphate isomerase